MIRAFIDSNFFIALLKQNDECHQKAQRVLFAVKDNPIVFYTSYYIVDETATVLSMRISKGTANQFLQSLADTDFPILLEVNNELRLQSYKLFTTLDDKNISIIDCYSAVLMKMHDIKRCFTFDYHFKKLGFEILTR